MEKLNDIERDLNTEIDMSYTAKIIPKISKLKDNAIIDLEEDIRETIIIKGNKKIKLSTNSTNNFDGIGKNNKQKDINLVIEKKNISYYREQINNYFKKIFKKIKLQDDKNRTITKINFARIGLFIIFLLFLGLLAKITIEINITSGYENILALKNDFKDLDKARKNIRKARTNFFIAKSLIFPISFIPNNNIKNAYNLVSGGYEMTGLLVESLDIYDETSEIIINTGGIHEIQITKLLGELRDNYTLLYESLYSSLVNFSKIGDLGDLELNAKLEYVYDKLYLALRVGEVINDNYDTMLSLLGENSERKYLVLFQNNDEIRATGGFMGSTALISLSDGKITDISTGDIYALEWDINKVYTDKERAPEGLNRITNTFGIRDANYYPEFKDSSQKIKNFLDMIDYNIDGIIYINQNIVLDLLEAIGGVESEVLEETIDENNFSLVLSTLVEAKVGRVGLMGTPKQILFDFANELYNKLLLQQKYFDYANILLKHLGTRDIVFYSFNNEENSLLWKLGLNGDINYNEKLDFNYPVYTSIGGNKTDRYMDYRYDKIVMSDPDTCAFYTTLEIYNSQNFSVFEDEKVNTLLDKHGITRKNDILNIQGRGDNKTYLRVIIPPTAEVNLKPNQKLIEYPNYNLIELYTTTEKLQTSKNIIDYTIINPNCEEYSYMFYKQPGIKDYSINFNIFNQESRFGGIETDFEYRY